MHQRSSKDNPRRLYKHCATERTRISQALREADDPNARAQELLERERIDEQLQTEQQYRELLTSPTS